MRVELASPIDLREFRARANTLLALQVLPAHIEWHAALPLASGIKYRANAAPAPSASALQSIVPRSFLRLTELVLLHRDPGRFGLLYRLLWRLVHEPHLASSPADADFTRARGMAQAVRRDTLRCRSAIRLRPLPAQDGVVLWVASFEPQHQVTEVVAQWLARQRPAAPWLLATPDRCILWTGRHLLCGPAVSPAPYRLDDAEWQALAVALVCGPSGSAEAPLAPQCGAIGEGDHA